MLFLERVTTSLGEAGKGEKAGETGVGVGEEERVGDNREAEVEAELEAKGDEEREEGRIGRWKEHQSDEVEEVTRERGRADVAKGKTDSTKWTCRETYNRWEVVSRQRYALWVGE